MMEAITQPAIIEELITAVAVLMGGWLSGLTTATHFAKARVTDVSGAGYGFWTI